MPDEGNHIALVREVLAAAGLAQPAGIERAREGVGNHVYFAGDVVVRLGTGSDAAMFPRSIAVMRVAASTVSVPEVIFEDCSRTEFELPVMVLARVAGVPLSRQWPSLDDDERFDLVADAASQLSLLHQIDPQDVPSAGFTTPWWAERVSRIERLLVKLFPSPAFPRERFESMARYLEEHRDALSSAPQASVLHGDVNWGNVMVANNRVTALLDFDDALSGPREGDWWQLAFRGVEATPKLAPERLRELPEFDLSGDGVLERFKIGEIQNVLDLLSGDLSWIDSKTAVAEAHETYEDAFVSDRYERLRDRLI